MQFFMFLFRSYNVRSRTLPCCRPSVSDRQPLIVTVGLMKYFEHSIGMTLQTVLKNSYSNICLYGLTSFSRTINTSILQSTLAINLMCPYLTITLVNTHNTLFFFCFLEKSAISTFFAKIPTPMFLTTMGNSSPENR